MEDHNGSSVPGAKVTLSNSDTGFSWPFMTNDNGQYTFISGTTCTDARFV